jgi:hypothetical protein
MAAAAGAQVVLQKGAVLNNRYVVGEPVGKGAFGYVYAATSLNPADKTAYVVKAARLSHAKAKQKVAGGKPETLLFHEYSLCVTRRPGSV